MPEIQAFRAIRYNLGRVGSLGDVVAPPYDVISPELQEQLYRKHPNNVVRLILNRIEPGDDDEVNNRYTRAKRFLKSWQSEGVLFTEPDPAIYVYQQEFTCEGVSYIAAGLHGPDAALAVRRGAGLPARRDHARPQGRPPHADDRLQGEPEPDLRPVPGPGGRGPAILDEAVAG